MRIFVSLSLLATLLISSYATTAHATASDNFSCSGSLIVDDGDVFSASCDGDFLVSGTIESDKDILLIATDSLTVSEDSSLMAPNIHILVPKKATISTTQVPGPTSGASITTGGIIKAAEFNIGRHATVSFIDAGNNTLIRKTEKPRSIDHNFGSISLINTNTNVILFDDSQKINIGGLVITPVPEPSTNTFFFIGLALLCFSKRLQFMPPLLKIQN